MKKQEEVFKELKKRFTKELVLAAPDLDGRWRPVAFLSKSLNEIEKNYKIYDKRVGKLKISIRKHQVQV